MPVSLHRGDARATTTSPGVVTRHAFSAGRHWDPGNVAHGCLLLHDEHLLEPGAGFPPHPHREVEVVTWVLAGALVHDGTDVVRPGEAQVLSAGSGTRHSEVAGPEGAHVVQAWVGPDELAPPRYARAAVAGELVTTGPLALRSPVAELRAVRAPRRLTGHLHAFVAGGSATWGGERLVPGDALRSDGDPVEIGGDALLLVWRTG